MADNCCHSSRLILPRLLSWRIYFLEFPARRCGPVTKFSLMWATAKSSTKTLSLDSFFPPLPSTGNREATGKCVEDGKVTPHAVLRDDLLGQSSPTQPLRRWPQKAMNLYFTRTAFLGSLSLRLALPWLLHRLKFKVDYSMSTVLRNGLCLGECQSGKIWYPKLNIQTCKDLIQICEADLIVQGTKTRQSSKSLSIKQLYFPPQKPLY